MAREFVVGASTVDDGDDSVLTVIEEPSEAVDAISDEPTLGEGSLAAFLEQVALVADADQIPDEGDGVVTLMTLHTAKGLEFPVVFLTGLEDGVFPHMRSMAEQHRARGGASPRLRRHHPGALAALRHPGHDPRRVGSARPTTRRHASSTSCPRRWSTGGGSPRPPPSGRPASPPPPRSRRSARPTWPRARRRPSARSSSLSPGDRVSHDKFGLGTVIAVEGQAEKSVASVDFGSQGVKRLLLRYAPVEKL